MKNINWKDIGWNALKVLFIVILNTPLWVYLIGSFVPYTTLTSDEGVIYTINWIDHLRQGDIVEFYHIPLLILFVVIGIITSLMFIKWLIEQKKLDKRMEKQTKALKGDDNETPKKYKNL